MANILLNKLQPGKTYTVAVKAIDSEGNMSPNSITYTFTTPKTKLDGSQLVATNTTVVTAIANDSASVVGGALTAGSLDANGLSYAGKTNLATIWNSTSGGYTTNASLTSTTASAGAVIINSTGILGYQFGSATNVGQANFFLNTLDGNAYFRGTIYAGAGNIGGWALSPGSIYNSSSFINIYGSITNQSTSLSISQTSSAAQNIFYGTTDTKNYDGSSNSASTRLAIGYTTAVSGRSLSVPYIAASMYDNVFNPSFDLTRAWLDAFYGFEYHNDIYKMKVTLGIPRIDSTNSGTGAPGVQAKTVSGNNSTLFLQNNSGSLMLGFGTTTSDNSPIYSTGIRYSTTTSTAGKYPIYIDSTTSQILSYTSTNENKTNINNLSLQTKLSESIPKQKISSNRVFDPFKILNISPVTYNSLLLNDNPDTINVGFIIEDIGEKVPELSVLLEDGSYGMYNLDGIVASILAVVQNQQEKIKELEQRLASLENK